MRKLDLSQLSVPQLKAVRAILVDGAEATVSKAGDEARAARKELAELKREREYRAIVESYDLEWGDDSSYWLSFAIEDKLKWVCQKLSNAMKEAKAEAKPIMKIPQMVRTADLNAYDTAKQGFADRKNGG